MKKIVILTNVFTTLTLFRSELLKALHEFECAITVVMAPCNEDDIAPIRPFVEKFIFINAMERRGLNPLKDLRLLQRYLNIIKTEKPDLVITYTIKPNIYGGIACRLNNVRYFSNITGLGSVFNSHSLVHSIVSRIYRTSLKQAEKVFFQNIVNRDTLLRMRCVRTEQVVVLNGSGVNLNNYEVSEYPANECPLIFLYIGRIMTEKGINELFNAICKVKANYTEVSLVVVGWYEERFESNVEEMVNSGHVVFKGHQKDVRPFISAAHCIILPSYHEGMSNVLLEGAAMARPLIASDIPGCRETIVDGETGFLVKPRDADDLFQKIKEFIEMPYKTKKQMGLNSRRHIEEKFDRREVVSRILHEIGLERTVHAARRLEYTK